MAVSEFEQFLGATIDNGSLLLVDILGSGHSGVVFRALDLLTPAPHKQYAVKCLHGLKNKAQRDNEVNLHCAVSDHPSIISVHRVLETDNLVFLVMDLCPGGDLWSAVTERHVYWKRDELVRSAFLQIVDAIDYCHRYGVFHRDIKLENILSSHDGSRVWISDFGLATTETLSYQFGVGTGYYTSPECLAGTEGEAPPYSPAANDVWSLGIVLINMLSGLCAWTSASIISDEQFRNYCTPGADHICSLLPISREADTLIRRILHLNPWQRISLPELKRELMQVKTFFMTDEEIALANERVRASASTQHPTLPGPDVRQSRGQQQHDLVSSSDSSYQRTSDSSVSSFSFSSGASTLDSAEWPATPTHIPTPPHLPSPVEHLDIDSPSTPQPPLQKRPDMVKKGSSKSVKLKQNATQRFQAIVARLKAL